MKESYQYSLPVASGFIKEFLTEDESVEEQISQECDALKELLLSKNRKYGSSFSTKGLVFDIPPAVAIKARLNDKFSRLKNDNKDEDEDIVLDILGYLILLRIVNKQSK